MHLDRDLLCLQISSILFIIFILFCIIFPCLYCEHSILSLNIFSGWDAFLLLLSLELLFPEIKDLLCSPADINVVVVLFPQHSEAETVHVSHPSHSAHYN